MHQPLVSIITPSFNRAYIVQETASSIFRQTYTNWEWIIVDDGSTDNSLALLQSFAASDQRIKLLSRNRLPKGACTCRNIAVENASGAFLIFLDTDDLLASFCIEQRVTAALALPESDFIIFPMLLFRKQPDDTRYLWNIDNGDDDIMRVLYGDPICQGTGTLWKKQAFVQLGMWDHTLALWQDIDLHLRALLNKLPYSKRMDLPPDIFIRISEVSLSRTGFNSSAKIASRVAVFAKALQVARANNLLAVYQSAFRYMGKDIFISAANANAFGAADQVRQLMKESLLTHAADEKWFAAYLYLRKFKLYKLPFGAKAILKRLERVAPVVPTLLGKLRYEENIMT